MLRLAQLIFFTAALCLGGLFYLPATTHACGGCFAPVGQPSVVTAHRMVVSISNEETTLWDLFEYAGDPEDFVWVLPVSGGEDVDIALADQSFFQFLANRTQVTIQGPTRGGGGFGCSADDSYPAGGTPAVTVYAREVVGPYETVTIGAEDAGSLTAWLTENGYAVPDTLSPTIAHYVEQDMSFVVLRLSPNAGVAQMQPVRVTTPGAQVTFPLRMVAAGVGESVSLELYLIGEGRWEAQNFPNAEITENDLAYDWASNSFNYDTVATDLLASNDGRTWLTEFSNVVAGPQAYELVTYDELGYHGPLSDWEVATRHLLGGATVTRMRAELPANALANDLVLQASALGSREGNYFVVNEINRAESPGSGADDSPVPFLVLLCGAIAFASRPRWLRRTAG